MNKKRIAILGSTGTIGINTLKVCKHLANEIEVVGLAVHSNIEELMHQIKEFQPKIVSVWLNENRKKLKNIFRAWDFTIKDNLLRDTDVWPGTPVLEYYSTRKRKREIFSR